MKKQLSHYKMAQHIRHCILMHNAESTQYTAWSKDFALKNIQPESITKYDWFKPVNPSVFTEDEMENLGFRRWSKNDPFRLMPLWLLPFLQDGGYWIKCIDGTTSFCAKETIDNDHRFGSLAYGVYPTH